MEEVKHRIWDNSNNQWAYFHFPQDIKNFPKVSYDPKKTGTFIGMKDKNEKEIYSGDIVKYAVKEKLCPICSAKEWGEDLKYQHSQFCPHCGTKCTDEDFITTAAVRLVSGGYQYYNEREDGYYQAWPTYSAEIYIAWVEVVGNVFENPEISIKMPQNDKRE